MGERSEDPARRSGEGGAMSGAEPTPLERLGAALIDDAQKTIDWHDTRGRGGMCVAKPPAMSLAGAYQIRREAIGLGCWPAEGAA